MAQIERLSKRYAHLEQQKAFIGDLAAKTSGITKEQREMMFEYVRHGEVVHIYRLDQANKVQKPQRPMSEIYTLARKSYVKNLTFIFNLFFEYGFLNACDKGEEGYWSQMFEQTTYQKNQALIQENMRECWQE